MFVNPEATEEQLMKALRNASCQNLLQRAEKVSTPLLVKADLNLAAAKSKG